MGRCCSLSPGPSPGLPSDRQHTKVHLKTYRTTEFVPPEGSLANSQIQGPELPDARSQQPNRSDDPTDTTQQPILGVGSTGRQAPEPPRPCPHAVPTTGLWHWMGLS